MATLRHGVVRRGDNWACIFCIRLWKYIFLRERDRYDKSICSSESLILNNTTFHLVIQFLDKLSVDRFSF